MTSPTDTTPLSERLAALKDRMGSSPETDSLTGAMAQLDDQQGHLLTLVAALTEDVQELAPRLVAELQALVPAPPAAPDLRPRIESLEQLVRALAEVVNENADSHQAALTSLQRSVPGPTATAPDLGPRLDALAEQLDHVGAAVVETADTQRAALAGITLPAVPDLAPRVASLEKRLDTLTDAVHDHADAQSAALTGLTSLIEGLHEHIDAAALAAVEAILSTR